jgi:hypothetical protein
MRRLMVTRRRVPAARLDAYEQAWRRLRGRAVSAGGRAWRFRSSDRDDAFLEFVEWSDGIEMEAITARSRDELDAIAPGQMDGWQEA